MQNPVCWFEIYVDDMDRAKRFYEGVFQINLTHMPMPEIEMWGFPSNENVNGCSGTIIKMPGCKPSGVSTVVYFSSQDCNIEENRVQEFGGKIHKTKFSIGPYGFITLAFDTEGNMFGIHSLK